MPREVDLRSKESYQPFVVTEDQLPPGAQEDTRPLGDRALDLLLAVTRVPGAEEGPPLEFAADPSPARSSLGASTIHLTQVVQGIPVLFSNQAVRFGAEQAVQRSEGRFATSPPAPFRITRTAEAAAEVAVSFLDAGAEDEPTLAYDVPRVDLSGFAARTIAEFPMLAMRPTVLEAGPLAEPVRASLVWLAVGQRLRLCWDLMVAVSDAEGAYQVVVAADDTPAGEPAGPVFLSTQLVASAGSALVYEISPAAPRVELTMPRPWAEYGPAAGLPSDVPEWAADGVTEGYSNRGAAKGSPGPVAATGAATWAPADPLSADAQVVNAFFFSCWMHDWFYVRGFREGDGSFQDGGITDTGRPCHKLVVQPSSTSVPGTACYWGLSNPPMLKFGPDVGSATHPGTGRASALDRTVISHEYMHGVSARLVANGALVNPFGPDDEPQGLNEGTSDYIAVTVTGQTTLGSWLKDTPLGMRQFPYDEHFPRTTNHFGKIGSLTAYPIGQLWCATLLAVDRAIGTDLTVRVLLDALRSLPGTPPLLSARDAMYLALRDCRDADVLSPSEFAAADTGMRAAFYSFGMGPLASSESGYQADGPPDLER